MKPTLTNIENRIEALEARAGAVDTSALVVRELPGEPRTTAVTQQIESGRPVVIVPPKLSPKEWTAMAAQRRI